MAYDMVIRGATICDGSGKPRYTGDVAIEGGTHPAGGRQSRRGTT